MAQLVALRQSSTRLYDAVDRGTGDDGALVDVVDQVNVLLQSTLLDMTGSWINDFLDQNKGESAATARNVVDLISAHQQHSDYTIFSA